LDIAVFNIARCLYISHLCGPSGIPPTIVTIFDRLSLEHIRLDICASATVARLTVASTDKARKRNETLWIKDMTNPLKTSDYDVVTYKISLGLFVPSAASNWHLRIRPGFPG
jgi:hypothetical protein